VIEIGHVHNEAVLVFLGAHRGHPNIRRFLQKQDDIVRAMNAKIGTKYRGYLEYLEANAGDDAPFTIEELKMLLEPCFSIELDEDEKRVFDYDECHILARDLVKPVRIKDEGNFFSVWSKDGKIDVPVRFLEDFRQFLWQNRIAYSESLGAFCGSSD